MQVYLLTFPNGKQYVGQTIHSVRDRVADHGRKDDLVGNAIRKHGDPEILVLAHARSRDELDDLERQFIEQLDTQYPNGYNLTDGGRMAQAKIGNTNASGKRSPEFREKMRRIALQRATRRGQKHGQQSTPAP